MVSENILLYFSRIVNRVVSEKKKKLKLPLKIIN